MKSRPNPLLRISAAVALACATSASAQSSYYWQGDVSSDFQTGDNWVGGTWAEWNDYHFGSDAVTYTATMNTSLFGTNSISLDSGLAQDIIINGSQPLFMGQAYWGFGGTITIAADSKNLTIDNAYGFSGNATWDVGANRTLTVNGQLGNAFWGLGNVVKQGAGTAVLSSGSNNFGGNTTISAGTLEVTSTGKLYGGGYTASPIVTVGSGAVLKVSGWNYDSAGSLGALDFSRDRLVVNGGTLEYTGASNFNPGDPGSSSRNLTIGTGGATLKASSASGQTWTLTSQNGNLTNNNGLTLDGAGAGEIQKVIEGSSTVTKTGAGTWTLSGANTYSGDTTVSVGTLALSGGGSIASSATVAVESGATLDVSAVTGGNWTLASGKKLTGSGLVTGATTIAGTHAPGNSPSVQSFSGNLTYASTSIFEWDLASSASGTRGTQYDGVNVGGTLSGATGAAFKVVLNSGAFTDTFWDTNQTWSDIFKANVDGSGSAMDIASVFSAIQWYEGATDMTSLTGTRGSFTITGTTLTWTAIPEPTSALAGLLLTAGLLRRRR